MARPMKPLVRGGGYYPSNGWTPLVYAGGYTTANGGEEPAPPPIEKNVTGNPIHITDALAKPVQALSVKLEPIQDLHGYDSPWPEGGGKNKLDPSKRTSYSGGEGQRWYEADGFTLKANQAYTFSVTYSNPITLYIRDKVSGRYIAEGSGSATYTPTEDVVVYFQAYRGQNISSVDTFQLELGSSKTSFAPYSNICPISGWTGATVTRTGKNLVETVPANRTTEGITFTTNEDGTVRAVGTSTATAWWKGSTTRANWRFLKAGTYILTGGKSSTKMLYIVGQMVDGTPINNTTIENVYDRGSGLTFTLPKDSWLNYQIQISSGQTVDETYYPMIRLASSTATAYEPYQGETYDITFPSEAGTVYGGTLDVTTGKLTVDRALWTASAGNLARSGDNAFYSTAISNIKYSQTQNTTDVISNKFKASVENNQDTCFINTNGRIRLNTSTSYSTATDMLAEIGEITVSYPLATPIVYDLAPQQVELLLGENNLFSDGTMTLVYLADGNASDVEALNILLGNRYVNNHEADEPTDREALDILLGR